MWCHFMLFMPVGGLVLFVILPWQIALPTYSVISAISLLIYYEMMKAMGQPVRVGREALLGANARVVTGGERLGQVRRGNELWGAVSEEKLTPGEWVTIVGFQGMKVLVTSAEGTDIQGVARHYRW
jgi:membrane protein implicated in regulation of membrane protease activity